MSGADIIAESIYHESEARRNLRDLEDEQRREGLRREAFSYEDFLSRVDGGAWEPSFVSYIDGNGEQSADEDAIRASYRTFESTFDDIFNEAFELLVERQRKYGPENIRKLGLYGVFTRIEDKMERIRHSFQGGMKDGVLDIQEVNPTDDETLDDADFDAANYHLIRIALRRGVWGRPLESKS